MRPLGDGPPLAVDEDERSEAVGVRGEQYPVRASSAQCAPPVEGIQAGSPYCSIISSGRRSKSSATSGETRIGVFSMLERRAASGSAAAAASTSMALGGALWRGV